MKSTPDCGKKLFSKPLKDDQSAPLTPQFDRMTNLLCAFFCYADNTATTFEGNQRLNGEHDNVTGLTYHVDSLKIKDRQFHLFIFISTYWESWEQN
jgi:hypothetical protein